MGLDDDVQTSSADKAAMTEVSKANVKPDSGTTHYARGKLRSRCFITSAMHIVAERDTPTRQ
jgi:hypothetical protein